MFYKHFKNLREIEKKEEIQRKAEEIAKKIVAGQSKINFENGEPSIRQSESTSDIKSETKKIQSVVAEAIESVKNSAEVEENEIVQVRALASLGLIVSSFAHELKEIKNNSTEIESLEELFLNLVPESLKKSVNFTDGLDIIDLLKNTSEKIDHWVSYVLTASKKDKRKRTKVDIGDYSVNFVRRWTKILNLNDVALIFDTDKCDLTREFRAFEMDLNTILSNLVNNSIDAFNNSGTTSARIISINASTEDNEIKFEYRDNGPGLSEMFDTAEEIFQPFTTSKTGRNGEKIGTGLGMYLVDNVVQDNNGTVQLNEQDSGFGIDLYLPLVRKNNKTTSS